MLLSWSEIPHSLKNCTVGKHEKSHKIAISLVSQDRNRIKRIHFDMQFDATPSSIVQLIYSVAR